MGEMQSRKCDCLPPHQPLQVKGKKSFTQRKPNLPQENSFYPYKNKTLSRVTLIANSKFLFTTSVYFLTNGVLNLKEKKKRMVVVSLSFMKTRDRRDVHNPNAASMRNYWTDSHTTAFHVKSSAQTDKFSFTSKWKRKEKT